MAPNPALALDLSSGPLHIFVIADDITRAQLATNVGVRCDIWVADDIAEAQIALLHARAVADLNQLKTLTIPAVVLCANTSVARMALAQGARGAIRDDSGAASVVAALVAAVSGLTVLDMPSRKQNREHSDLTAREFEVLEYVARGCSNRDIASLLEISEHTVKFHVGGLLNKLCAATRAEAVAIAAREQLL